MPALAPDAPRLDDWITLTEAAELLGVSKQAVHKMVTNRDLRSLHQIGDRPVYIVSEAEVTALVERRRVAAVEAARRRAAKMAGRAQRPETLTVDRLLASVS